MLKSKIHSVICKNSVKEIVDKLQSIISGQHVKSIRLVDCSEDSVVILLSESEITQEVAEIWWSGYTSFMGDQNG